MTDAAAAGGATLGALAGPVGAAGLALLAGAAFDAFIEEVSEGLRNGVSKPIPVELEIANPTLAALQPGIGTEQALPVKQKGADYTLFCDWHLIPADGATPPPVVPPVTSDVIQALSRMGVDFSAPEATLRDWLANPAFTPYPAISQVLLFLGRQLKSPVFST
ncbi:hypothetical protein ACFWVP_27900 [Streptomyces sp. NPDC058637]|uniref:hypothetical protein n=1 Tax=Streptomyces sp. NPDC058637 TaxID=3346569 RepID=UPI003669323B